MPWEGGQQKRGHETHSTHIRCVFFKKKRGEERRRGEEKRREAMEAVVSGTDPWVGAPLVIPFNCTMGVLTELGQSQ